MNKSVKNRPETIPETAQIKGYALTPTAIPPDRKTGRTGQKIPGNDTEKIQFYRPIRDTHGNGRKERTNATHEQQAAA